VQFVENNQALETNLVLHVLILVKDLLILSIIMTISGIVSSFFFQSLIENMNSENNLKLMCYVFIILFILKIFSNFFRNKIFVGVYMV